MVTGQASGVPAANTEDVRWFGVVKRTFKRFQADNGTSWAAALTYFAILSLFPALLVFVSVLGILGDGATQPLLDNLDEFAPGPAKEIAQSAVEEVQRNQGASGIALVIGLVAAIWSASGYVGAFMPAANVIWDVEEGRPLWKRLPLRIGLTVVLLVLLALTGAAVVLTGPVAEAVGNTVGLGSAVVTAWDYAKWPVLLLLFSLLIAVLYWVAPNVRQPGFRFFTPGSMLAVLLWVASSLAFTMYVANFASYNSTYGTFGGVIVFLVWVWITNIAILFGAEFNAELERCRIPDGLRPPEGAPFAEPRDPPKDG